MSTNPNIKYLIAVSPDGLTKTILNYQYPGNAMADSWFNWTNFAGSPVDNVSTLDHEFAIAGGSNYSAYFEWGGDGGGQTPQESDINMPSWMSINPTTWTVDTVSRTGNFVFTVTSNGGTNTPWRYANIAYTGNIVHSLQDGDSHNVDVQQEGTQLQYEGKSERHLKDNIKLVGASAMGIPMYHFNYKDETNGKGTFIGTMVDELQRLGFEDVLRHTEEGILVDYSKIDVPFHTITH